MTDIAFALFIFAIGALNLGLRLVHGRWADVLLVALVATILWGLAVIVFKVRLFAPIGELTDILIVFAGIAMFLTNAVLEMRSPTRAKTTSAQPQ